MKTMMVVVMKKGESKKHKSMMVSLRSSRLHQRKASRRQKQNNQHLERKMLNQKLREIPCEEETNESLLAVEGVTSYILILRMHSEDEKPKEKETQASSHTTTSSFWTQMETYLRPFNDRDIDLLRYKVVWNNFLLLKKTGGDCRVLELAPSWSTL